MKQAFFMNVFIGLVFQLFAQTEYSPGFVVKSEGDTLWGYVDFSIPAMCTYKTDTNETNPTIYAPDEIKGYGNAYQLFASKPISSEGEITRRVFMNCLVQGRASLYQYVNSFYISKADTLFYPLIDSNNGNDGASRRSTAGTYTGVLAYLLNDCRELRQSVSGTPHSRNELTSLIIAYNRCIDSDFVEYKGAVPSLKVQWGISGGVNVNFLKMQTNDANNDFLESGPAYHSASVVIGAEIKLSWPYNKDKWGLSAGMLLLTSNFKVDESVRNSIGTDYYKGEVKTTELKIPVGARYYLNYTKTRLYFSSGISASLFLNHSSDFSRFHDDKTGRDYTDEYELFEFAPMDFHVWFGFGAEKKLSEKNNGFLEIRYEIPGNISASGNISTSYSHLFVMAGYRFK